jgi:cytosine/adenosine deaminase-related metal-dependent hydrolase
VSPRRKPYPDPLLPAPLIVAGRLVTFDESRPQIDDAELLIDPRGQIEALVGRGEPRPAGFEHANRVETAGVIYPGLIDLHNHIAYNCLPLWIAPGRAEPWTARDQWPDHPDYKPSISLPTTALCRADGKAVLKYVETKAVVGGVTAIQGSAKVKRPFEGWMVRNVEHETFRTGERTVNQSVRELSSEEQFADARRHLFEEGHAFLYHLAEGSDPELVEEYEAVRDHDCLAPRFVGIHSTALREPEFRDWQPRGGSIVWSPFSNLWLYGQTTDVLAARDAGMRICLGADWSPSGSKNLLGELKVADLHNRRTLDGAFTAEELCRMATSNPAEALGWEGQLGRLKPGLRGDFVALSDREDDPYDNLVRAVERDVELVAINGYPMYGRGRLMKAAAAVNPEPLRVGGSRRWVTLHDERFEDADMSWPQVLAALEAVRRDPMGARPEALARAAGAAEHLELVPDKPWDALAAEAPLPREVAIPPLDPLAHGPAYFRAIERAPLHGGQLDGLRAYYESR